MSAARLTSARDRVVDFLGDLGSRWGLPAEACRVHGYLYLVARPAAESELHAELGLNEVALAPALAWLTEYHIIERVGSGIWRTGGDPWELVIQALRERQRREMGPALSLLHECRRDALAGAGTSRAIAVQIGKLLRLAEDIAAINRQAERMSPAAVRQMVGLGGFAARILNRAFGRGEHG